MAQLQRLDADHASGILAFELANRVYFASSVTDRGDGYFDHFAAHYRALLAEQQSGRVASYVLVADDRSVLGRFNLYDIEDQTAELGYRVAASVAGRGVATATATEVCRLAGSDHGVRTLRARTTHDNVASRRVLTKVGFVAVGPVDVAGRPGTLYERNIVTGTTSA